MTINNNDEVTHRVGEDDISIAFRTNRFFTSGMKWYFSTREGIDQGSYESRIIAQAIQNYICERQY